MSIKPFSIYDALLGSNPSSNGATSLIRTLLRAAANTALASSAEVLSACSIVKTARLSCDELDDIIRRIDELEEDDGTNDAIAWRDFNKYVQGIRDLERFLLQDDGLFNDPQPNLRVDTVLSCEAQILSWEKYRTALDTLHQSLHGLLHTLKSSPNVPARSVWEQRRDDAFMLHTLNGLLKVEGLKGLGRMKVALAVLLPELPTLDKASTPHPGIVNGIKGAWAVYAATLELQRPTTNVKRRRYLGNQAVHDAIKSFANAIKVTPASDLGAAYKALIQALKASEEAIPNQRYLNLIRESKRVRRPFMYQNFILLDYCHQLVELYNSANHDNSRAANEAEVISALETALAAVKSAAEARPNTQAPDWAVEATKKTKAENDIGTAVREIKSSLAKYKTTAEVDAIDRMMSNAKNDDTNWFDKLKDKCNLPAAKQSLSEIGNRITVTLKINGQPQPAIQVPELTKIRFLLWNENQKVTAGFIKAQVAGTEIDLERTVKDAAGNNSSVELTLLP